MVLVKLARERPDKVVSEPELDQPRVLVDSKQKKLVAVWLYGHKVAISFSYDPKELPKEPLPPNIMDCGQVGYFPATS